MRTTGSSKSRGASLKKKNKYFFMWVNSLSVGEFDSDFFASTTDDKENSRDEENRFEKDQFQASPVCRSTHEI